MKIPNNYARGKTFTGQYKYIPYIESYVDKLTSIYKQGKLSEEQREEIQGLIQPKIGEDTITSLTQQLNNAGVLILSFRTRSHLAAENHTAENRTWLTALCLRKKSVLYLRDINRKLYFVQYNGKHLFYCHGSGFGVGNDCYRWKIRSANLSGINQEISYDITFPPPLLYRIHGDYLFMVVFDQNWAEVLSFPPAGVQGRQGLWHICSLACSQNIPFTLERSDIGGFNIIQHQGKEKAILFQNLENPSKYSHILVSFSCLILRGIIC
jgi:hypothetical protein